MFDKLKCSSLLQLLFKQNHDNIVVVKDMAPQSILHLFAKFIYNFRFGFFFLHSPPLPIMGSKLIKYYRIIAELIVYMDLICVRCLFA